MSSSRSAPVVASTRRSCACRARGSSPATTVTRACSRRSERTLSAAPEDSRVRLPRDLTVAPSILSADFSRLGAQVGEVLAAGARVIHVDVMDGHFVPPITFGAVIVGALADQIHAAGAIIDVHLMIERPERHVEELARAGADGITVSSTTCLASPCS